MEKEQGQQTIIKDKYFMLLIIVIDKQMSGSQQKSKGQLLLRYSDYAKKDSLYNHLNQLQIDNSDCLLQNSQKCTIIRINIQSKIDQHNDEEKKRIRFSQMYTRQNLQIMNQKLKGMRNHRFASSNKIFLKQQQQNRVLRTSHANRPNYQNAQYFITQVKGVASSLQINNRPKTTQKTPRKTPQQFHQKQYGSSLNSNKNINSFKNLKVQSRNSFRQQKQEDNKNLPFQNQIIPRLFKPILKKKCVEDNLNVMAMLIKKKVKVLNRDQMHSYITKLMNRNSK